ncbi:MAG: hypothetical protein RL226_2125 [Bacteroidota bacterium]
MIVLLLATAAYGQINRYERGTPEWYNAMAKQQIVELKNSVILFRLPTNAIAIEAARKKGLSRTAARMESELRTKNLETIKALREGFTFCRIYFFYADETEKIMQRRLDEVQWLSDSLTVDPSVVIPTENFFTAELTLLRADTLRTRTGQETRRDEEGRQVQVPTYTSGPDPMFEAIIIKSDQFIQLHRPFPYYSRTFNSLPFRRSMKKVVRMLNENLELFYRQSSGS